MKALHPPFNFMQRQLNKASLGQRALLWVLGCLVRLWGRTLRVEGPIPEGVKSTSGRIVLLWHNTLFVLMELRRRYCPDVPGAGLISASKDGAWLAGLLETMGLGAIRGSSSFRGSAALREGVAWLQQGGDLAITPDGPRGPRYKLKPGAAALAKLTGAPIILVSPRFANSWRFNSWDGFHLPKPFSTVYLSVAFYENFQALGLEQEASVQEISEVLGRHLGLGRRPFSDSRTVVR